MQHNEPEPSTPRSGHVKLLRELESLRARIRELEASKTLYARYNCFQCSTLLPTGYEVGNYQLDFHDIFNVEAIQAIQDAFAAATNVASIITDVEGRPITRPSRFCRLCQQVVRRTPKGLANCIRSDASFGSKDPLKPMLRPCLSSGLWDGGTSIYVGDRHVANWVVGQVRISVGDDEMMRKYAAEIGVDDAVYMDALSEVPVTSYERFYNICQALCLIANQISTLAQQNYLQAQAIELRRQAEQALRESEERFRQFSEATFEGIFIHKDGVVMDVNTAGRTLSGYPQDQIIGQVIDRIFIPMNTSQTDLSFNLSDSDACIAELVRADQDRRICEIRERDIVFQGSQASVLVARDITERVRSQREAKEKQAQLIQADKMVSLGVLVAGMAHEINNPNSFMTLNLPLLQDIWSDISPVLEEYYGENGDFLAGGLEYSELRSMMPDLLARMHEGATRIRGIVGSLKNFSRRTPDEFKWDIDINDVIRSSLELVGNLVAKSTNRFDSQLPDGLPTVTANPQKISQVLINLVVNACEALSNREQAILVQSFHNRVKNEVVVRVRDEGSGIAPHIQSKIMDPFFTTKREVGGTGLGLSVSSAIVEEHGGSLKFTSRQGCGTIVDLCLPVSPMDNAEQRSRQAAALSGVSKVLE